MAPLVAGGLISGIGSLLGGILGIGAQSSANSANMELAKYAFDRNYQMWQEENAYNSPAQQMERLRAAGLNPNLVYGSGSVAGNTSGSTPKFNAPTMNPVSNGGFISDAVHHMLYTNKQLESIDVQNELAKTQTSVQESMIAKNAADTARILQDTARSKFDFDLASELRNNSISLSNLELDKVRSEIDRNTINACYTKAQLALLPIKTKLTEAQYNNLVVATGKAAWEFQQEKEGRFVGSDFWSQIANQAIRFARGESNMFDSILNGSSNGKSTVSVIDKLGKKLFGNMWDKWLWQKEFWE